MNITSDMIVLYVADVAASANFYAGLFGRKPVDQTPGFALFALDGGMKLGLFLGQVVQPAVTVTGGGAELVVSLDSKEAVDALLADWRARGVTIGLDPVKAPFGYTFIALDPDQHRIRAMAA